MTGKNQKTGTSNTLQVSYRDNLPRIITSVSEDESKESQELQLALH